MAWEAVSPLEKLQSAVREFQARDDRRVDAKGLRSVIDALEAEFSGEVVATQRTADHLPFGFSTAVGWLSHACGMSRNSLSDRLCVGKHLEDLPRLAAAVGSGEISYQLASVLCHLREQLSADKRDLFVEEEMLEHARRSSVHDLRMLCRGAFHAVDPEAFYKEAEEDFTCRKLHISQLADGMHLIDGLLDPVGGAALKAAIDSLAKRLGPDDERTAAQRRADCMVELVHHAMDQGTLPRRNGVRPHITMTTTLEGLKDELGVPPAELELSIPVSTRTLERVACDCTMSRVLLADSVVTDVGQATRTISPATRRGLHARDRGCRFPGCERPVNWTSGHHIEFWSRGGPTRLTNLLSLCYFHHRLVHEGGWQIVKVGCEFRFIPPERAVMRRARGPGMRWAA
ncbi:MAG: DUF222 domain-containing protein [Candidatus Dormiibacterota bacterium]